MWKMWKRSFRATLTSRPASSSFAKETFVRLPSKTSLCSDGSLESLLQSLFSCSHCFFAVIFLAIIQVGNHRKSRNETVDGQKNQTLQRPTEQSHRPQISMLYEALYSFLCVRVWFFCPPAAIAQPESNIEIWGCRGDTNTARVWFHRPSTVVICYRYIVYLYCIDIS